MELSFLREPMGLGDDGERTETQQLLDLQEESLRPLPDVLDLLQVIIDILDAPSKDVCLGRWKVV